MSGPGGWGGGGACGDGPIAHEAGALGHVQYLHQHVTQPPHPPSPDIQPLLPQKHLREDGGCSPSHAPHLSLPTLDAV